MRRETPRWAFVVWPQETRVSCIPLGDAPAAVARGAVCVAREDADLVAGVTRVDLRDLRSNPRRRTDDREDDA